MNFRDDTRPPLSTELSDLYWGTHLTYTELYLEDLDERSSRLDSSSGRIARRVPAVTGARGVDCPVAPLSSAPADNSLPVGGPTTEDRS